MHSKQTKERIRRNRKRRLVRWGISSAFVGELSYPIIIYSSGLRVPLNEVGQRRREALESLGFGSTSHKTREDIIDDARRILGHFVPEPAPREEILASLRAANSDSLVKQAFLPSGFKEYVHPVVEDQPVATQQVSIKPQPLMMNLGVSRVVGDVALDPLANKLQYEYQKLPTWHEKNGIDPRAGKIRRDGSMIGEDLSTFDPRVVDCVRVLDHVRIDRGPVPGMPIEEVIDFYPLDPEKDLRVRSIKSSAPWLDPRKLPDGEINPAFIETLSMDERAKLSNVRFAWKSPIAELIEENRIRRKVGAPISDPFSLELVKQKDESDEAFDHRVKARRLARQKVMQHYFGAGVAVRLMNAGRTNIAKDHAWPAIIEQNHAFFYDIDGNPRTVEQLFHEVGQSLHKPGLMNIVF